MKKPRLTSLCLSQLKKEIVVKDLEVLLLVIPILAACASPATPATKQPITPRPPTVYIGSAAPTTESTSKGNIEGVISWLTNDGATKVPVQHVNLELNGHSDPYPRYTTKTDPNGHYAFEAIEPNNYGLGIYLNLPVSERLCEAPEYHYTHDLDWLHYATALRGEIWYDILFSSKDVVVSPGEIIFLNLELTCP
jgi:hypothetical protein